MKIIPIKYNSNDKKTDAKSIIINAMRNNKKILYIFNDNTLDMYSSKIGGGNAIVRQFNEFSKYPIPYSAGIPTGRFSRICDRLVGFKTLDISHDKLAKKLIDFAINRIKILISMYKYDTIYFNINDKDEKMIGTSLFKVGTDIREYIYNEIMKLKSYKIIPKKYIKILKEEINYKFVNFPEKNKYNNIL